MENQEEEGEEEGDVGGLNGNPDKVVSAPRLAQRQQQQ